MRGPQDYWIWIDWICHTWLESTGTNRSLDLKLCCLITRHSYSDGNVHEERRARALTLQHATQVSAAQASRGITKRLENLDRFCSFLLSLPHSLFHTLTHTTHTRVLFLSFFLALSHVARSLSLFQHCGDLAEWGWDDRRETFTQFDADEAQ